MPALIQMDYAVLNYLVEVGGSAPSVAIPARLFRGIIPEGHPDMIVLGLIKHDGELVSLTSLGREAHEIRPVF
jgi:hypothetical protein